MDRAYFFDKNLNYIRLRLPSKYTSKYHWAALEFDSNILYSMNDGTNFCINLVDSDTLKMIYKHTLTQNKNGYCLCKLNETHIILG